MDRVITDEQLNFLFREFGLTEDGINALTPEQNQEIYEKLADIEIEETYKALGSELSERGRIAVELVNFMSGH